MPTCRFIRGQEGSPDKVGRPQRQAFHRVLEFAPWPLKPIPLPADAWQSDPALVGGHRVSSGRAKKVEAAESHALAAREKLAKAEQGDATIFRPVRELCFIAELVPVKAAKAEHTSVEKRAAATLELAKPADSTSTPEKPKPPHSAASRGGARTRRRYGMRRN